MTGPGGPRGPGKPCGKRKKILHNNNILHCKTVCLDILESLLLLCVLLLHAYHMGPACSVKYTKHDTLAALNFFSGKVIVLV